MIILLTSNGFNKTSKGEEVISMKMVQKIGKKNNFSYFFLPESPSKYTIQLKLVVKNQSLNIINFII